MAAAPAVTSVPATPDRAPSSARPPLDTNTAGMYYDVEAALLGTFRLQDSQLHTTWDQEKRIIAVVELTRPLPSLAYVTQAFYRFWGQVCLAQSEVRRDLGDDAILFTYHTSGDHV